MTLVRTGGGVTDIRGGLGGVYFTRDKSGLHSSAKPRRVHQITPAQDKQRKAFIKARSYTKDPRWVSYYIYRALNNLPFIFDAIVTEWSSPDCSGTYKLTGKYNEQDYWTRTDSALLIWYHQASDRWYISTALGAVVGPAWYRDKTVEGAYQPGPVVFGNPVVTLSLTPPPTDYQIPKL